MKKRLFVVLLLCIILVGCGNKENNDNVDNNDNVVTQPIIENGLEVSVIDLKFFVPKELTVNSYNGINMTYNYYIENDGDNCEVYLTLTSTSKYESSINKYMNEYNKVSDFSEVVINNSNWYLFSEGNNVNYSTIIGDYFYNVRTKINQNGTVCSKVNDMINSSLYIVKE